MRNFGLGGGGSPLSKSFRKNVVLSPVAEQRIRDIRKNRDISSDAEAIREALKLYDDLMQMQMKGFDIAVKDRKNPRDGRSQSIPYLYDKRIVDGID